MADEPVLGADIKNDGIEVVLVLDLMKGDPIVVFVAIGCEEALARKAINSLAKRGCSLAISVQAIYIRHHHASASPSFYTYTCSVYQSGIVSPEHLAWDDLRSTLHL
jgi:hypothetical protein